LKQCDTKKNKKITCVRRQPRSSPCCSKCFCRHADGLPTSVPTERSQKTRFAKVKTLKQCDTKKNKKITCVGRQPRSSPCCSKCFCRHADGLPTSVPTEGSQKTWFTNVKTLKQCDTKKNKKITCVGRHPRSSPCCSKCFCRHANGLPTSVPTERSQKTRFTKVKTLEQCLFQERRAQIEPDFAQPSLLKGNEPGTGVLVTPPNWISQALEPGSLPKEMSCNTIQPRVAWLVGWHQDDHGLVGWFAHKTTKGRLVGWHAGSQTWLLGWQCMRCGHYGWLAVWLVSKESIYIFLSNVYVTNIFIYFTTNLIYLS